jgi:hypothetical protein
METALVAPNRRVEMWYEGTERQNRWTVGFRLILIIPQFFVLLFIWIAAGVVAIIGWFGALFMGRLPEWAHSFISGVLRWSTRVSAYGYLLTDAYPPFSLEDEAYPARPFLPAPGPLNRWTVLFRWVLVWPASVFAQIVWRGLFIPLAIVAWFIVLIGGRMPPPLYWAYAALLRYETRVGGYFLMLTSEYAWGMLGDSVSPTAMAPPSPPFAGSAGMPSAGAPPAAEPPRWGVQGAVTGAHGEPTEPADDTSEVKDTSEATEEGEGPAGTATPPQWPPPPAAPPQWPAPPPAPPQWPPPAPPPAQDSVIGRMPPPSPWERAVPVAGPASAQLPEWGTLVLAGAARGWMIFAIVWGSVFTAVQGPIQAAITRNNTSSTVQQFNTTSSDVTDATSALVTAAGAARSCSAVPSAQLSPAQRSEQQIAAAKLTRVGHDLSVMSFPANATSSAQAVESDASQMATIFNRLGAAPDCTTYGNIARSSDFATVINSYPADVGQLLSVLHADATS